MLSIIIPTVHIFCHGRVGQRWSLGSQIKNCYESLLIMDQSRALVYPLDDGNVKDRDCGDLCEQLGA